MVRSARVPALRPRRHRFVPMLLAVLSAACASADGAYVAMGDPEMPLYKARTHCREQLAGDSQDGAEIDWTRYDLCMSDLGWVKSGGSTPAAAPAPPSGGGGGPSY